MAVRQMGVTVGGNIKEFIGTAAEIVDAPTTDLGAGSTYWAYDTKVGYIWDTEDWREV